MKFLIPILFLFGCSSKMPVLPETSDVKVSREVPADNCENLGPIEGRSTSINEDKTAMLEDLKMEAIKKGANFVKVETLGAQGSAIRGIAYLCK